MGRPLTIQPKPQTQKEVLWISDVTAIYGPSTSTLHEMIKHGKIRFLRIGRRIAFRRKDIEAWLKSCEVNI